MSPTSGGVPTRLEPHQANRGDLASLLTPKIIRQLYVQLEHPLSTIHNHDSPAPNQPSRAPNPPPSSPPSSHSYQLTPQAAPPAPSMSVSLIAGMPASPVDPTPDASGSLNIPPDLPQNSRKWNREHVKLFFEANQEEYDLEDDDIELIYKNKVRGRHFPQLTEEQLSSHPYNISGGAALPGRHTAGQMTSESISYRYPTYRNTRHARW